jgi:hypothetical protein
MSKILYLTDLYYTANGRNYYAEDLMITSILKNHFDILIGHPHQVLSYMDAADLIVIRNTGSIIYYKDIFQEFVKRAKEQNLKTFNSLDGKGDLLGKQYLVELTRSGYPVIPTVDHVDQLDQLGDHDHYIIKLIDGADSIGMSKRAKNDVKIMSVDGKIIQPCIDFVYELSFYYLNDVFQYALYAPDKNKRWVLETYEVSASDLMFADQFIQWNQMSHGIQRVDACRLRTGELLLVELEDINPYLSLEVVTEEIRDQFMHDWLSALSHLLPKD